MGGRGTGKLEIVEAIAKLTAKLEREKLVAQDGTDFREWEKLTKSIPKKQMSEQFSLKRFELFEANAFWICHRRAKSGRLVSIQAFRLETLDARNLADHWRDQQKRIYPNPNRIGKSHAPLAKRISGRVVYTGDFWVAPEIRKSDLSNTIAMKGILLCLLQFDPDWLYGFMAQKLVLSGFAIGCGFDYCQPAATHWITSPKNIDRLDWLIASEREGLQHRANTIADED